MARFPPNNSVLRSVKMTRTAYAQLVGQKFYPPKVFGRWEEREGTKEWRWKDIGMKIVRRNHFQSCVALLIEYRLWASKCYIKRARADKAFLLSN